MAVDLRSLGIITPVADWTETVQIDHVDVLPDLTGSGRRLFRGVISAETLDRRGTVYLAEPLLEELRKMITVWRMAPFTLAHADTIIGEWLAFYGVWVVVKRVVVKGVMGVGEVRRGNFIYDKAWNNIATGTGALSTAVIQVNSPGQGEICGGGKGSTCNVATVTDAFGVTLGELESITNPAAKITAYIETNTLGSPRTHNYLYGISPSMSNNQQTNNGQTQTGQTQGQPPAGNPPPSQPPVQNAGTGQTNGGQAPQGGPPQQPPAQGQVQGQAQAPPAQVPFQNQMIPQPPPGGYQVPPPPQAPMNPGDPNAMYQMVAMQMNQMAAFQNSFAESVKAALAQNANQIAALAQNMEDEKKKNEEAEAQRKKNEEEENKKRENEEAERKKREEEEKKKNMQHHRTTNMAPGGPSGNAQVPGEIPSTMPPGTQDAWLLKNQAPNPMDEDWDKWNCAYGARVANEKLKEARINGKYGHIESGLTIEDMLGASKEFQRMVNTVQSTPQRGQANVR